MKSNRAFVRNQGNGDLFRAILVTTTSEYLVKRVMCDKWTGTFPKSADPDQGLHSFLKLQEVKG